MRTDQRWMLMTYYCPTHGHEGRMEQVEMSRKEISEKLFKKKEFLKKNKETKK